MYDASGDEVTKIICLKVQLVAESAVRSLSHSCSHHGFVLAALLHLQALVQLSHNHRRVQVTVLTLRLFHKFLIYLCMPTYKLKKFKQILVLLS